MTAIVVRGLELAIEEMHRFSKSAGAACSVNRNDMVGLREMNERHAPHLVGTSKAKQIEAN